MRALGSLFIAAMSVTTGQAGADTPKPSPQVEAIRSLIGSWSGKGAMTTEGKTHQISVTYDCNEASAGAGVRCKLNMIGIPGFTYVLEDLWGYSAQDGLTHWYAVTNAGEVHDHRGHFDMTGGVLQIEVPVEGKLFSEVITFKRKGKNLAVSWTASSGGSLREKGEFTLQPKTK